MLGSTGTDDGADDDDSAVLDYFGDYESSDQRTRPPGNLGRDSWSHKKNDALRPDGGEPLFT